MKAQYKIIGLVVFLITLFAISRNVYKSNIFGNNSKKSINIFYILLILLTIFTLIGIIFSYKTIKNTNYIQPVQGKKGKPGFRGQMGNRATPLDTCNDDLCYKKIMDHITNVFNVWNVLHYKPIIPIGKHIKNNYLKGKVKEICDSKEYKLMLKDYGAHKLNVNDNPLNTTKCNINENCGAYDYILQKWTEWILIILKYKQGEAFLNSPYSTEKEFNNMIHDDDYKKNELTKNWIFDMEQSITNILLPKNGNEKMIQNQNKLRSSAFGKFYLTPGVPSAFKIKDKELTTEEKFFKILSPFEEIKKYDTWYWGTPVELSPQIINHCELEEVNLNNKYINKIKVKCTNTYTTLWDSANAGQTKYKIINSSKYDYLYEEDKLFGNKKIQFLRPKMYIDEQENDLFFKNYKPVGDVIYESDETSNTRIKKHSANDIYPIGKRFESLESSLSFKQTGPNLITLLVSGDVKHPVDFELVFKALRTEGFSKNEKALAIWKPIPPPGYVSLGCVIDVSTSGLKPDTNSIVCVPENSVSTERIEGQEIWQTKNTRFTNLIGQSSNGTQITSVEKQNTDIASENDNIVCYSNKNYNPMGKNNGNIIKIKSDKNIELNFNNSDLQFREDNPNYKSVIVPYLENYNTIQSKKINSSENVNSFYKIKEDSLFYEGQEPVKKDVKIYPQKKNPKEYSILSIYDAKL